ncbi:MAG: rod shape-determining protein MreC [Chitinophagaceae bacterium]|nr:rod shape-determining protein MreC [Chitinophagaceae bacterium]
MRNLFAFIRRYSVLLFFLVLEGVSISLLVSYNKFHQAAYMDAAGEITGSLQTQYASVENYFHLKKENQDLRRRLNELQNRLPENFQGADTAQRVITDSIPVDTSGERRRYIYMDAQVVNNSISQPNNYITLHRGSRQGVEKDMVVVGPNGVVGVVLDVTENFSTVMSMLHKQSRISARLKKTGESGRIEWDGAVANRVQLKDIPKSVKVQAGDTVLTSQYSDFPPGVMIGVIEKVIPEKSANNYLLQLKTSTDFSRLQNVFVVKNLQRNEQKELEQRIQQKKK